MSESGPSLSEIGMTGSDSQVSQTVKENVSGFTRRKGLIGVAATSLRGFLPKVDAKALTQPLQERKPLEQKPLSWKEIASPEIIDRNYIPRLLTELVQERGDAESRERAIKENLVQLVPTKDGYKLENGKLPFTSLSTGTALKIDESGYYLTAAHVVMRIDDKTGEKSLLQKPILLFEGNTGNTSPVQSYIIDTDHDLAIIYCPTGLPRKPVDNLQLSISDFQEGEQVSQVGFDWQVMPAALDSFTEEEGEVDVADTDHLIYKDATLVKGVISPKGTSGGPVYTQDNIVKGVISGYYGPEPEEERLGGRVTKLTPLKSISFKPRISYYENGQQIPARMID